MLRELIPVTYLLVAASALAGTPTPAQAQDDSLRTIEELEGPSLERLKRHVYGLADDSMMGRFVETRGFAMAVHYAVATLSQSSVRPLFVAPDREGYTYLQQFSFEVESQPSLGQPRSYNVAGLVPGADPRLRSELLVVGAHLDHMGWSFRGIYNGASDNASGVAVVLEVARLIAQRAPRRTVVFALFGAEELGHYGSIAFVDTLAQSGFRVIANINVDDVGHLTKGSEGRPLMTVLPGNGICDDLMDRVREHGENCELAISTRDPDVLWEHSDHFSFHQAGIPVLFFTSGRRHKRLHSFEDDPQAIDFDRLQRVARLVYLTTVTLSEDSAMCSLSTTGR
jgi:hypothetical protein